ncbi:hypothetical protein, partial [Lactococcus lactis]
ILQFALFKKITFLNESDFFLLANELVRLNGVQVPTFALIDRDVVKLIKKGGNMIKIPINATKLLGSKVTVDKTIEPVAKTSTESGYTKYRATSPLQPQGFELRVPNGKGAKPTRRQEVVLTDVTVAYVRNRTPKGKYSQEYVVYAEALKLA